MRGIKLSNLLLYGIGLLLVGASATPSHASTATGGQFNTPYLVFGTQPVGQSGLTQTGTLTFGTGFGLVTVTINSITVSGTNAGDFSATGNGASPCNVGTTLTVNVGAPASCTVGGTFTPTATGTRTATITVNWSVSAGLNDGPVTLNVVGGDEVAYVTTGPGAQVLTVDGTTGAFEVLSNGPACTGTGPCFNPTGAAVGPDGKIYLTDSVFSNIWRMNQDGSTFEAVYRGSGCPDSSPCKVEGPSFSASGTGDLYFNTLETGQGLFVIAGAATTPVGGPFNAPANVEPGVCDGCGSNGYPYGGTGTAFDANGNLLAADQEDDEIWSLSPPYNAATSAPTVIASPNTSTISINQAVGIALDKANGQVFVANSNGFNSQTESTANQIVQLVPPVAAGVPYTTTGYYTFTSTNSGCEVNDEPSPDLPEYISFDMTGHLFGTTSTTPLSVDNSANSSGCGRVWRIDPGTSPTATMLVDLNAAFTNGITNGDTTICFSPCGLNGGQAIGLAMPPTQGPTQTVPLLPTGGSFAVGIPVGCIPTNLPPNNCFSTISGAYPAGMFGAGDTLNVTFNEETQQQYGASVFGSPYSMTTLAPVAGFNGDGIVPSLVCLNGSGNACNDTVVPGTSYDIYTTWQTTQTDYCSLTPHLLKGEPVGGSPYSSLADTIIGCTESPDPAAGTKGQSSCSSTSSSGCLSSWPNSYGPVTGPTAGVTATATITGPANSASFLLNQPETATFACAQTPSSPSIVVSCPGVVTEPNGTIASVASGGSVPTSQAGTYTLSVTPNVDGGSGVTSAASQYTVVPCQDVGLSFNPSTVAVGKSTTVTATFQSCASKTEFAVLQFDLTGPLGKNCGTLTTPVLSVPAILGTKPISFNFPLKIPPGACSGTYTVTASTFVKGTLVDTISSSLVVTPR